MSGFKKGLFLFLALLLPVIVFVFLKLFGKNEFEVKPLFQDAISVPTCQAYLYKAPYSIPDSILRKLGRNNGDSIMLIVFDDKVREKRHVKFSQIQRIQESFPTEKLAIRSIIEIGELRWLASLPRPINIYELPYDELITTRNCIFLLPGPADAVLVDAQNRIVGQYDLDDLDDGDRLVVHELNILFNRY